MASTWKYDVFLSFRGEDTRKNFVDHLYEGLHQKGIYTFKDDEQLQRGNEIRPSIQKAIEESRFAIIVFSKEYASSFWCLDELVKIVKYNEEKKIQKIVPVFYQVEPSEVRNQTESLTEAFANHERVFGKNMEKVQRWKAALVKATNITGYDTRTTANGYESKCIQEIVTDILDDLGHTFSMVDEHLVGIVSRVEKVNSLLSIGSNDVRFIGIWGLGGIGKTTIAEFVFNQNSYQFEGWSYLQNVREVSQKHGVQHLQKKLLSDILGWNGKVSNVHDGINKIKDRLHKKRVLVVLDDVDHLEQIDNLAGNQDWFGLGSRIIITTRDKHLLRVDSIYEVSLLNNDEAIQLLSMNAFKMGHPTKGYEELLYDVVHYAGGLPLALKVLGCFLFGRDMTEWRSTVNRLKEIPEKEILEKLRISYDGLKDVEKEIFLDIVCFFNGKKKDSVIRILDSFDFHPKIGIRVLIEKCLIIDSQGLLIIHDLIRDLGRYIACGGGYLNEPEKWSRLWRFEDVRYVLEENTGPNEVEGIVLKLHGLKKVNANTEAFKKMNKLRLLMVSDVDLSGDLEYLPNNLRWLDWHGYPSKSLPKSFHAESLGGLIMCYSRIVQLWKGRKELNKLKVIDLSYSHKLTRTPDFTGVPNLETLILKDCTSLLEVHPSVGNLTKLSFLNLRDCESLKSFPSSIQLPSLDILILSGCLKLKKFPEIIGNIECLEELCADGTAMKELPSSIEHLTNVVSINLSNCKSLMSLPETICQLKCLKTLILSGCSKLDNLPKNLGDVECLEELHLDGTAIMRSPSSIGRLKNLKILSFRGCKGVAYPSWILPIKCQNSKELVLRSLSGLSFLTDLDLSDCNIFDGALCSDLGNLSSLEELNLSGNKFVNLPGSISRLSRLKVLKLQGCKNLEALPELPSSIAQLYADECHSLKSLIELSMNNKLVTVSFSNCLKLLQNKNMADMLLQCMFQALLVFHKGYSILVPGTVIPQWFSHQTLGSSLSIRLPPRWYRKNLMGVALCGVCEFTALGWIDVQFKFRNHDGSQLGTTCFVFKRWFPNKDINSEHLWLTCVSIKELELTCLHCRVGPNESTMEVLVTDNKSRKYGVRLVYKEEEDTDNDGSDWYDESCQSCAKRAGDSRLPLPPLHEREDVGVKRQYVQRRGHFWSYE